LNSSPKIQAEFVSNSNFNSNAVVPFSAPPAVAQSDSVPKSLPELPKEEAQSPKSNSASKSFENAKDLAMEQIDRGQLKEGLATLSVFYNAPELTSEQRQDLLDLLDALAREVVFSRRHFLAMVYVVAPGETLAEIAKRNDVPVDILARINAIDTKTQLPSGSKLKVVPGPFRAEIDLTRSELTVFLGDLYAGRYPVSFGNDPSPKPGTFQVVDKQQNKNYYGNGVQIPATDPRNPYGGWWIDLGSDYCIHGSADGPSEGKLGCISLSPLDASDVFGMLGRGSPVTIRP
jgi:LysM repeat protein